MNPVLFPGAVVLSHEGGDGDTKGVDDHPEYTVDLAVGGPGCDGIGSQRVDAGLYDDIGGGVHDRLKPCREADLDNPLQHVQIQPDGLWNQVVRFLRLHQYDDHQHGAD